MIDAPIIPAGLSLEAAEAMIDAAELGDGLPIVPPTEARLAAMLAGIKEPDEVLGLVPPMFGELTSRAVAYNAVLAGCRPSDRIVVETALLACIEPEVNLLGLMTTTGSAAIATLVHGPAVARLDMNPSINCLGPGNRANATIGRAVSLCLRNIGGAKAGSGDMATCGQPGKYAFCFAEGDGAPFPPLHVRRGLAPGTSAVTVLGVSGTAEVLPLRDGEGGDAGADAILDALAIIMAASVATTGAARQPEPPEQAFILPKELADRLVACGFDLPAIQRYIFDAGARLGQPLAASPEQIHPIVTGGPGVKMALLPLWGGGSRMSTRRLPD